MVSDGMHCGYPQHCFYLCCCLLYISPELHLKNNIFSSKNHLYIYFLQRTIKTFELFCIESHMKGVFLTVLHNRLFCFILNYKYFPWCSSFINVESTQRMQQKKNKQIRVSEQQVNRRALKDKRKIKFIRQSQQLLPLNIKPASDCIARVVWTLREQLCRCMHN